MPPPEIIKTHGKIHCYILESLKHLETEDNFQGKKQSPWYYILDRYNIGGYLISETEDFSVVFSKL